MRGRAPASVALSAWPWEGDPPGDPEAAPSGFAKTAKTVLGSGCGWSRTASGLGLGARSSPSDLAHLERRDSVFLGRPLTRSYVETSTFAWREELVPDGVGFLAELPRS